ncbi:MAG: NAD(P)/FAD-dependent oxidoreductase, partial [Blastocatellia bacterium]
MKATASTGHAERVSVAVIGGGPAGATAALVLAGSGVAVALLEHTEDGDGVNQDGGQEVWKIGEGLPPLARPLLNQLGLWERFVADGHLPSYGNCAAWGTPQLLDHSFLFDPHGHGWHLDRRQFDRMLRAAAIEAGAMNYCGLQVAGCHREAADWQLELVTAQAERRHLAARFVVDASGRSSWFARRQSARRINADGLVGLAALLSPPAET